MDVANKFPEYPRHLTPDERRDFFTGVVERVLRESIGEEKISARLREELRAYTGVLLQLDWTVQRVTDLEAHVAFLKEKVTSDDGS